MSLAERSEPKIVMLSRMVLWGEAMNKSHFGASGEVVDGETE
jgi:hypothetical protein